MSGRVDVAEAPGSVCERLGHDDEVTYQDDDQVTWVCSRCGAEGWEDF